MLFPLFSPLQLKIQDVHLRFEDGITNPSHPFAFGICIKNVSMQNAVNEPVSMNCACELGRKHWFLEIWGSAFGHFMFCRGGRILLHHVLWRECMFLVCVNRFICRNREMATFLWLFVLPLIRSMVMGSLSFYARRNWVTERVSALLFFSCYVYSWGKLVLFHRVSRALGRFVDALHILNPMLHLLSPFSFVVCNYLWITSVVVQACLSKIIPLCSSGPFCFPETNFSPLFSSMLLNVKTNKTNIFWALFCARYLVLCIEFSSTFHHPR